MNRRIAIPAIIFIIGVACLSNASAGPITYYVEPVPLDDGYTVEGGHITVADLTDALEPEDVMDYEVIVNGPVPFTFSPDNTNSHVVVEGSVTADPQTLAVRVSRDPVDGDMSYLDLVGSGEGEGEYKIRWFNAYVVFRNEGYMTFVDYRFPDGHAPYDTDPIHGALTVGIVPEPSTLAVAVLAFLVVVCRVRRTRQT